MNAKSVVLFMLLSSIAFAASTTTVITVPKVVTTTISAPAFPYATITTGGTVSITYKLISETVASSIALASLTVKSQTGYLAFNNTVTVYPDTATVYGNYNGTATAYTIAPGARVTPVTGLYNITAVAPYTYVANQLLYGPLTVVNGDTANAHAFTLTGATFYIPTSSQLTVGTITTTATGGVLTTTTITTYFYYLSPATTTAVVISAGTSTVLPVYLVAGNKYSMIEDNSKTVDYAPATLATPKLVLSIAVSHFKDLADLALNETLAYVGQNPVKLTLVKVVEIVPQSAGFAIPLSLLGGIYLFKRFFEGKEDE